MTRIGKLTDVKNAIKMLRESHPERFEVDRSRETYRVTDTLNNGSVVMSALLMTAGSWIIRYNENYFGD